MGLCGYIRIFFEKCLCLICPPLYHFFFSDCNQVRRLRCTNFWCGFVLGQAYCYYVLSLIPLPCNVAVGSSVLISIILGISTATSIQVRCILLLILPMYCGKAGRGVMKVLVLTFVVAGPITNMGLNAREVVRVFSCSTQLSYNLSVEKHRLMAEPFRRVALGLTRELEQMKDAFRSIREVVDPIEHEIENIQEIDQRQENNGDMKDSRLTALDEKEFFQRRYHKKMEYRCEKQFTNAVSMCGNIFHEVYSLCYEASPPAFGQKICPPLRVKHICDIMPVIRENGTCSGGKQLDSHFGEGYLALKRATHELTDNLTSIQLQYKVAYQQEVYDVQDAKETGQRVIHAFDEKTKIANIVVTALNVYIAIELLRIMVAAATYHDRYLTSIEYDNIYVTRYFKRLDEKRRRKDLMTLLPLKKMERIKYVDVTSLPYEMTDGSKLLTQIMKVALEVITATTFVMLDRLFYEALDVVRQHAQIQVGQDDGDLKIEVKGTGTLASIFKKLLSELSPQSPDHLSFSNKECVPHPRAMSFYYYFKIYGGYLWILLLVFLDPYTVKLKRLICSYFYPRREKQRILHLYNDILKKRVKMSKTLRRIALQAVRAHYLSAENLLSLRMKFPQVLGWLKVLPAARMTCLICGEIEPRTGTAAQKSWHGCVVGACPFVSCGECWQDTGALCLACDPALLELSDVDPLSDDEHPKF